MPDYSVILPAILRQYPFRVIRYEHLRTSENAVVKLISDTGTPYALRIRKMTERYREQVTSELVVLHAFHQNTGVEIPIAHPTCCGDLFCMIEWDGVPYAGIVFSWVPGVSMAPGEIRESHMLAMGRTTARFHQFSRAYEPPPGFVRPIYGDEWFFGQNAWSGSPAFIQQLESRDVQRLFNARDCIRAGLQKIPGNASSFGLIHYDLHVGNFLFQDGQANMIDFDECGFGFYLFDVAHILFEFIGHPAFDTLRAAAISSYAGATGNNGMNDQLNLFLALQGMAYVNWLNRIFLRDGNKDAATYWIPLILQRLDTVLGPTL